MTTPLHYKTAGQMLDEPAAGLNEEASEQLIHLIREFREPSNLGCDILIVEHDHAPLRPGTRAERMADLSRRPS